MKLQIGGLIINVEINVKEKNNFMAIKSIEDSKILRNYCETLRREGVAIKIIELAKEIVKQEGAYQSTIINAGKIRALAMGCNYDGYWGEKQSIGFENMVCEAKHYLKYKGEK